MISHTGHEMGTLPEHQISHVRFIVIDFFDYIGFSSAFLHRQEHMHPIVQQRCL